MHGSHGELSMSVLGSERSRTTLLIRARASELSELSSLRRIAMRLAGIRVRE